MSNEFLQLPRGTRDLLAPEKILKNEVLTVIQETMEEFGFDPIETPALELQALWEAKFSGGAELLKEVYKLKDRGNRKLVLRPESTPPLARVVASYRDLPRPFKRYVVGPVWRDGPIKLGRFREFWQCDIDTVGPKVGAADAEIVALTLTIFKKLGLNAFVKINNRKVLNAFMEKAKVPVKSRDNVILSIDKFEKIGWSGVEKELREKKLAQKTINELEGLLSTRVSKENIDSLVKNVDNDSMREGVSELKEIFELLKESGFDSSVEFDPYLARGLSYYTGPIFEFFVKGSKMTSSVCGGGRWDDMIGKFRGGDERIPVVGVALGLDAILSVLKLEGKVSDKKTVSKVLIIPLKTSKACFKIASELRSAGVKTELDLMNRNLRKNLDYANAQKIPFIIIVGEKELKSKKLTLRNMETGEQKELSVKGVIKALK
ncbi:MAG: histidine--tRNA ligase [Candidatus Diapherotrites archaeon]|nr:histidine--tRNA ligase [Candidatus Diapherotrites archaeon]